MALHPEVQEFLAQPDIQMALENHDAELIWEAAYNTDPIRYLLGSDLNKLGLLNSFIQELHYIPVHLIPRDIEVFTVPTEVYNINKYAFSQHKLLKEIIFDSPSDVQTIEDRAFAYSGLRTITIPDSVNTLGSALFIGCTYLRTINIPKKFEQTENWKEGLSGKVQINYI